MKRTHQHQRYNGPDEEAAGLHGQICLTLPARAAGRIGDDEPYDAAVRLAWYVERATEWLCDAASGSLALPGEPFELPDFPGAEGSGELCAFLETAASFSGWEVAPRTGVATVLRCGRASLVSRFSDERDNTVHAIDWHSVGEVAHGRTGLAMWLRLDKVPVAEPWHPPRRFGELAEAFRSEGRDLFQEISHLATRHEKKFRGNGRRLLLVGFPMPRTVDGEPELMHWQAIRLPKLSTRKSLSGFRPDANGFARADRTTALRRRTIVEWIRSENWADEFITSRGALPRSVTSGRIVVIGGGSLGSAVAEILVRAGARDVAIVDKDRFVAGNGARHTLTLVDVNIPKAAALADRLGRVSPSARVVGIVGTFPLQDRAARNELAGARMVVDTTGNDAVIADMEAFSWTGEPLLVSLSLGHQARRLFAYASPATVFSGQAFHEALEPWLSLERSEPKPPFAREGVGCWHPVFPARADDVWLMAAVGVKSIVSSQSLDAASLRVFEQGLTDDEFAGIKEVFTPVR